MDVTFRKATTADSDLLADMVFGEEGSEGRRVTAAVLQLDDIERLRPVFRALWRAAGNWRRCEIALLDGQPVGILMTNSPPVKINADVVVAAIKAFGLGTFTMARRMRIFDRVSPKKPKDSLVISELNVLAEHRNQGIGRLLMERAEAQARAEGFKLISLQTRTNNQARRLYERFGYEEAGEALDAEFERLTGVTGNVLYVKKLD